MKIVFNNLVFSFQKAGGISIVWFELVKGFLKNEKFDCYFVRHSSDDTNVNWSNLNQESFSFIDHKVNKKMARLFSPKIRISEKFIYLTSGYDICNNKNAINAIILHDFIYEIFGTFRAGVLFNKWIKHRAIRKADIIFCVSDNTKNDLLKRYPKIETEKKVITIHNGVSENYFILDELNNNNTKKYLLYVGGRSKYKNFDKIVFALEHLSEFSLIVVSGNKPTDLEIELLNSKLGVSRYEFKIGISEQELNALYNHAFCLAYPSSYEGFGIPIIEAQRAGCPVITCENSSIAEISGNAVIYLDDLSVQSFSNAFQTLEDIEFREDLINRGIKNSSNYSWEKMSSQYQLNLYSHIFQ